VFHHFYRFGLKIVTSIQAWIGDIKVEDIDWHNRHIMYELLEEKKGGIIISAHYGCLEICRALKKTKPRLKVVPLMYLKNAKIFRGFLKEINPASIEEVIEIDKIHAGIATNIQSRIDNGQFISILADRISENSSDSRTIKINFMGEDALIPEGPYTLASIFKCPVVTFITYYDEKLKKHQVYINRIDSQNDLSTTRREKSVQMAKTFFSDLEHHCLQQPYEWFNFFPFWKKM